jgi:3-isopropylmalate/(R)-2-methylmalate dehydratase large subunit
MAVEIGAKIGIMEADAKVLRWVKDHSAKEPHPVKADPDAKYSAVKNYDVSSLVPQVAKPHTVDNVADVTDVSSVKIDQAFVGTCTNGRLEDLEITA